MPPDKSGVEQKKLDSWKEIADYLGRDVRTAMRWEQDLGLPVRHVPGGKRRAVFAIADEIDLWLQSRSKEIAAAPVKTKKSNARWIFLLVAAAALAVIAMVVWRHKPTKAVDEFVFELPDRKFHFRGQSFPTQSSTGQFQAADVNGDGFLDLIVGGGVSGRLAIFINHAGSFAEPQSYDSCPFSQGPSIGDFDGDGKLDIALACAESSQLEVWWGGPNGSFTSPTRFRIGENATTTAAADLNGDGIADVAAGSIGGGPLVVLYGDRNRNLRRQEFLLEQPNNPTLVDIDQDGHLDIVVGTVLLSSDRITVLRGHGDGSFDPPIRMPAGCNPWRIAVADFNQDGILDIAASSAAGDVTWVRGIGTAKFAPPNVLLRSSGSQLVWPFSDRGKNYILTLQYFPGVAHIIAIDSQGTATVSNDVLLPNNPRYAVTGDFNHDGLTDLAFVSYQASTNELNVLFQTPQ